MAKKRRRIADWEIAALVLIVIAFVVYSLIEDWRSVMAGQISSTFVDTLVITLVLVLAFMLTLLYWGFKAWKWLRVHVLKMKESTDSRSGIKRRKGKHGRRDM